MQQILPFDLSIDLTEDPGMVGQSSAFATASKLCSSTVYLWYRLNCISPRTRGERRHEFLQQMRPMRQLPGSAPCLGPPESKGRLGLPACGTVRRQRLRMPVHVFQETDRYSTAANGPG